MSFPIVEQIPGVGSLRNHPLPRCSLRKSTFIGTSMKTSDLLLDKAWTAYEHGLSAETHDLNAADMWYELMTTLIYQYADALVMEAQS